MKRLALFAALAALAAPVYAGPTGELVGTWECVVQGAPPTKTPPIVWFGAATAEGKMVDTTMDLDGFDRRVSGISDIAPAPGGWWKVEPQQGVSFVVKPLPPAGKQAPWAMSLKLGEGSYRCRRLPRLA